MRRLIVSLCLVFWSSPVYAQEHQVFTELLSDHVVSGEVNYSAVCQDERLGQYTNQLATQDPVNISDRDTRLAFWINAYNAYTLKLICDHYPLKSIQQLHKGGFVIGSVLGQTAWDRRIAKINGELLSLGHIEHKIIRKEFDDARIHFAIVCAAKSCPPLRSEAYEGARLDEQLNEQGKIFLANKGLNNFDVTAKTANLSPIFSWFKQDFGSRPARVLEYLLPFMPSEAADAVRQDLGNWRIRYTPYDWDLNDRP